MCEVLLPAVNDEVGVLTAVTAQVAAQSGTETILVVEDEDGVRLLVERVLSRLGYRVLGARGGEEALAAAHSVDEPIDLVLCDVVMPNLSGHEIVSRVQARSPGTRALFMSGYTAHVLLEQEALAQGRSFIQKPFTPSALARKVR